MLAFASQDSIVQYPIGLSDLQRAFPDTSFTVPLAAADLSDFGVVEVAPTNQPSFDPRTQRVEEAAPALIKGKWKQQWAVVDLSAAEVQAIIDAQATSVRSDRNVRLAACDWTQLPDAPVDTAAWAAYRQDLRDVTAQAGFPWDVEWPTQP